MDRQFVTGLVVMGGVAMIGEPGGTRDSVDIDEEEVDEEDSEDVYVDDDDDSDDNVGDISVEINVDELVAKLEATDTDDVVRRREIRRRLEELREMREAEKDIDSTYNFNLDDDL